MRLQRVSIPQVRPTFLRNWGKHCFLLSPSCLSSCFQEHYSSCSPWLKKNIAFEIGVWFWFAGVIVQFLPNTRSTKQMLFGACIEVIQLVCNLLLPHQRAAGQAAGVGTVLQPPPQGLPHLFHPTWFFVSKAIFV